jgi:hypothetical protein
MFSLTSDAMVWFSPDSGFWKRKPASILMWVSQNHAMDQDLESSPCGAHRLVVLIPIWFYIHKLIVFLTRSVHHNISHTTSTTSSSTSTTLSNLPITYSIPVSHNKTQPANQYIPSQQCRSQQSQWCPSCPPSSVRATISTPLHPWTNDHSVLSLTYTTIVARKEGQHVDNARTRFQQQRMRGNQAMSDYGARLLEQQQLQQEYEWESWGHASTTLEYMGCTSGVRRLGALVSTWCFTGYQGVLVLFVVYSHLRIFLLRISEKYRAQQYPSQLNRISHYWSRFLMLLC